MLAMQRARSRRSKKIWMTGRSDGAHATGKMARHVRWRKGGACKGIHGRNEGASRQRGFLHTRSFTTYVCWLQKPTKRAAEACCGRHRGRQRRLGSGHLCSGVISARSGREDGGRNHRPRQPKHPYVCVVDWLCLCVQLSMHSSYR
jgi:hypothetical protein